MSSLPILKCTVGNSCVSVNSIKLHPLCVDEVLSVLFKYFSFPELKKLRVVCKSWEKEARHLLITESSKWELAPIILTKEKDASKFLNLVKGPASFLNFNTFYFVNFAFDPRKPTKSSKYLRLLQIYGHRIVTLHLRNLLIKGSLTSFVEFFNVLQQLCPNLERLVLATLVVKGGSDTANHLEEDFQQLEGTFVKLSSLAIILSPNNKEDGFGEKKFDSCMRQVFKRTPNLEEFTFFDRSGESKYPLDAVIESIQGGGLHKLNTIHIDSCLGDVHDLSQFEVLQSLKLRYLKVGLDHGLNPQCTGETISKFLETQQNTLTSLHLYFNVCDIFWQTVFKPELSLQYIRELNIPFKLFSFALLKSLHSLNKLMLRANPKSNCWIEETSDNATLPDNDLNIGNNPSRSNSLTNWTTDSASNWVFSSPLHLRLELIVDLPIIKKFINFNIHSLELGYISEDVLLYVYENFPDLRQLSIVCPPALYVSSRAYLGESKAIALTESRMSGFKLDIDTRNKVAEKIRQSPNPSILCLKKLRKLELTRFGSTISINRIHHSIECSSGFMFGISALQHVTELKLHPFIHKRAVMSLRLMPSLKVVWAVPLIIGSRETGGRSDYPTTAYWYQVLLRKRSELKIYVTTAPTSREKEVGIIGTATRLLQVADVYRGNATSAGLFVYLDEYFIYQDGCEVPKPERIDPNSSSCSLS